MVSTYRFALTSCVCQILRSLPQPVESERPAKAAVPEPAAQLPSQAPQELVWAPAEEGRQRMQPAKLAVYKMLIEDVGLHFLAFSSFPTSLPGLTTVVWSVLAPVLTDDCSLLEEAGICPAEADHRSGGESPEDSGGHGGGVSGRGHHSRVRLQLAGARLFRSSHSSPGQARQKVAARSRCVW